MTVFTKILIANRGEIACRVIRTCRAMGIFSIAVYSEADIDAEHVRLADHAILLGPAEASHSYLNIDAVLLAAKQSGAQAIHPGYGFLSENAEFAERVEASGLVFIGPSASSMRALGSKAGAKQLMIEHGVPVVPGYSGDNQEAKYLQQQADLVGFPLMIKAAHGGGGKGMRIVREAREFADALTSCQREARNAFGKDRVLLERYIEKPRHIEFQIFADASGSTIHLGERECSAQRRFQKVIEESPSMFLTDTTRQQMAQAAVQAARAVQYKNAGTVEFIVAQNGEFFFMEINQRLQVEHPVTEMVTGLDLVQWQIEIAAGKPLPLTQEAITFTGHAIEVRLYAEDPEKQFMPGSGVIKQLHLPATSASLRIDSGVRQGNRVSVYYDPMLAKLIVHAENRTTALHAMQQALSQCQIFGLPSNIRFLEKLIAHPIVQNAEIDTGYLDRHLDQVMCVDQQTPDSHRLAAGYFSLRVAQQNFPEKNTDPWQNYDFWRGHGVGNFRVAFEHNSQMQPVLVHCNNNTLSVQYPSQTLQASVLANNEQQLTLNIKGVHHTLHAFCFTQQLVVHDGTQRTHWKIQNAGENVQQTHARSDGFIRAPMPGKLVLLKVSAGQNVTQGEVVAIMEAMKMELSIKAPSDGTILEVLATPGVVLDADTALLSWKTQDV